VCVYIYIYGKGERVVASHLPRIQEILQNQVKNCHLTFVVGSSHAHPILSTSNIC
jgi:hypothetical protein